MTYKPDTGACKKRSNGSDNYNDKQICAGPGEGKRKFYSFCIIIATITFFKGQYAW